MSAPDVVGWISTLVLLATLVQQILKQWRARSAQGTSRWLFVGQCAASIGFLTYSAMVGSVIFVVSNALILATAIVGAVLTWYLKRHAASSPAPGNE